MIASLMPGFRQISLNWTHVKPGRQNSSSIHALRRLEDAGRNMHCGNRHQHTLGLESSTVSVRFDHKAHLRQGTELVARCPSDQDVNVWKRHMPLWSP